jgi:hypothetical protein
VARRAYENDVDENRLAYDTQAQERKNPAFRRSITGAQKLSSPLEL